MRIPLVTQMVKNLPAVQETRVQSLGQEDPLEKGMASYSKVKMTFSFVLSQSFYVFSFYI